MQAGTAVWVAAVLESMRAAGPRTVVASASAGAWSGDEFMRRVAGATELLEELGVPDGGAVPALFTNTPVFQALLVAGAAANRPLAPLGPRLTAREVLACIEPMRRPVLLAERACEELAAEVSAAAGCQVVFVDELAPSQRQVRLRATADSIAYVMHTSGTTGRPKRVPATQRAVAARVDLMAGLYRLTTDSVFVATSPIHHVAGLGIVAVSLATGATTVCFDRFTIEAWRALEPWGVTHVATVTTVVEMLMDADALALPTLTMVSYGSSASRPGAVARMLRENPDVDFITWYGQTEGSPMAYLSPREHRWALENDPDVLTSVGHAVPGARVVIHDPAADGIGEIWARADHLSVTNADGWLETGDLGRFDEDGWLRIVGRTGDMIICGGENVYPIEVEGVLAAHPAVQDVAVVGVDERRLGEVVKAYVVPSDPAMLPDVQELHEFARADLAGFKVPREWAFVAELPRNHSGKVLRRELATLPTLAR